MVTPTRTLGPLHLEDLEPHRFEDLVRQLIYDFRNWRALEPTGRSGSDDGFDARGFEVVSGEAQVEPDETEGDGEVSSASSAEDRVWLVQCKREQKIPPKKLVRYLRDIPESERGGLYGLIFVGASDFSKLARDSFRATARELGFAEAYLWGKGEVEDMLFQPKNDHLLFAYFGVSLQMRRRQLKTDVRAKLTTKRKALRMLNEHSPALIRDAADDRYPFLDEDKGKPRVERGQWIVRNYSGCFHDGLHFVTQRHFAFLDDDGVHWDYAETVDDSIVSGHLNPWCAEDEDQYARRSTMMEIWDKFPEKNKAWFEVEHILPFENILDIDDKGDDWAEVPHIYTTAFHPENGPFRTYVTLSLETIERYARRRGQPDEDKRVEKFPRKLTQDGS
ncbi:restriction endonuclease [Bradyrhizobium sp. CCBAU 45394]|uniref:restriction endonuclease n=1 Tax=Bradyrhizobium sp. CCBAU 45394 TaxID=1325087 RepID=UPI0023032ABB|nr:restriction endonuclease [Bradyrhizobium sp. CCBAU 45394]